MKKHKDYSCYHLESQDELSVLFHKIGHSLHQNEKHGGSQIRILNYLNHVSNPVPQKEIGAFLSSKPGSTSEILSKLEAKGYIKRTIAEKDHREILVEISPEGRTALNKEKTDLAATKKNLFACLSNSEKAELTKLLTKLFEYWKENENE